MNSYEEVKELWWNHLNTLPHLDSKEYIHKLVDFIYDEDSNKSYCLIVGGAKDIGKTTGIIFVSEAATRLGHDVFHLNLKTIGNMLDVGEVLRDFSWDVMETIHNMNDVGKLKCVYNNTMKCRKIKQSSVMRDIIATVSISTVLTVAYTVFGYVIKFVRKMWNFYILVIIPCWAFLDCATITYWLYFSGLFIQDRIANGDWNTAFCCIDAIGNCKNL